jgi:P pilus assembly chaperone PapD
MIAALYSDARPWPPVALALSFALNFTVLHAYAAGMVPETSVVLIDEALGEASIKVTNTDAAPALLYVTLEAVPEDPGVPVFVTPPVSRVEAGQSQLVRFIVDPAQPSHVQRLQRVVFEGIGDSGAAAQPGEASVGVSIRQNLPVLLHPAGLAKHREPWRELKWAIRDDALVLSNESPYVVRLAQEMHLQPGEHPLMLPRTYLLPSEQIVLKLQKGTPTKELKALRLYPATVYGFSVDAYDVPAPASLP